MSLTSFLQNRDREECIKFQEELKRIVPDKSKFMTLENKYKAFDTKRSLKVDYNLSDRNEASLFGIEFDYLARFRIAQIVYKNKFEVVSRLVAENFFYRFELPDDILNKLSDRYLNIKGRIKNYIENKECIDDKFINDIFTLSILEQCWRGNTLPKDLNILFSTPSNEFKEELQKVLILFESSFIDKVVRTNSILKYNPEFGEASKAIGGADADIYIDGTLYDFKCTKSIGYKSKDVQQIIGYYILDIIGKRRGSSNGFTNTLEGYDIERIALYSARIGEIYYFNINNIDKNILEEVVVEIEKILFKYKKIKKSNMTYKSKKYKKNRSGNLIGKCIKGIIAVILIILLASTVKLLDGEKYITNLINKFSSNESIVEEKNEKDIRADFENVKMNSKELLSKSQGFFKYYNSLISALRSYDISNINNAVIVYDLSDELLNDMYQEFKRDFTEEAFSKITSEQLIWIDNKLSLQKSLENDELNMYRELINMTLNKCEEWNSFYK